MTTKSDPFVNTEPTTATPVEPQLEKKPTAAEEFAKTATAAKLSGAFNESAGFVKEKWANLTGDEELKTEGRNQQLLGKVHNLVGSAREARDVLKKHTARIFDVAVDLGRDLKKTLFK